MTVYTKKVYNGMCKHRVFNRRLSAVRRFRHFFHYIDRLYNECQQFDVCSVSGHSIDLDRFEDIRVARLIRDPRDLVVSAYFYHKRAGEEWCRLKDSVEADWAEVRGAIPSGLPKGRSLTEYLNDVSLEEGLLAEIEFRKYHFQSMLEWPENEPRVLLHRYEDIIGREAEAQWQTLSFFGFPLATRIIGSQLARKYSASSRHAEAKHIRNPHSGQWRRHFTPELTRHFNALHGEILDRYGYPHD